MQSRIRKDTLVINNKYLGLRAGLGIQKSFYFEVGLSYNKHIGSNYGDWGSYDIYSSVEIIPKVKQQNTIYGVKIGAEGGSMGGQLGFEIKYLSDKMDYDVIVTPKIGFGAFSYLIVFYGYNFSTNNRPFNNIGKHQFSLVSNIGRVKKRK